jgi:hypothetical protein
MLLAGLCGVTATLAKHKQKSPQNTHIHLIALNLIDQHHLAAAVATMGIAETYYRQIGAMHLSLAST